METKRILVWPSVGFDFRLSFTKEFWVGNEELVRIFERRLGDAGYKTYILARTNNRGDGTISIFVLD